MADTIVRVRNCNRWIPPDHLAAILRAMRPEDAQICLALYESGYRVDDLLSVRVADLADGRCKIRERKTGKERTCGGEAMRHIERIGDYTRGRRMDQGTDYLIPARRVVGDKPRHLCRSTIWRAFCRAVRVAGLAGRGYTVHSLRKSYAVDVYRQTHSIETVQRALGHERAATTLIYLADYFDTLSRADTLSHAGTLINSAIKF